MRTTPITGALALVLAATALAACGASDSTASDAAGGYCQELKTGKAFFRSLDSDQPDLMRIDEVFEHIHRLAAAAPSGVATDWQTVDTVVTMIEGAFSDAGLEPDDLVELQKGTIPEGVDLDELATLGEKMQALSGSEVNDAADRIAEDAKDSCGIDLRSA